MVKDCPAYRIVDTPHGKISYTLEKKRIKNINLRIGADGQVAVSAPFGCPTERADRLIWEKSAWVARKLEQMATCKQEDLQPQPSEYHTRELLVSALLRVYPLVVPLGVDMPELKLRHMKSQWGNCHWQQGYITLNKALARCPEELRDYVALHELVHFIHHDHGSDFHRVMEHLMPDWRERRRALKLFSAALLSD